MTAQAAANKAPTPLADLEAHVLAHVVQQKHLTTYEVMRILERSPATSLQTSTGTIYPIVRRLKERGLLGSRKVSGQRRDAEHLEATALGRLSVEAWLGSVQEGDALPPDPLRTKLLFLAMLPKAGRIRFVLEARKQIDDRLEHLEDYAKANPGPFAELAYEGARCVLKARQRWLEQALVQFASA